MLLRVESSAITLPCITVTYISFHVLKSPSASHPVTSLTLHVSLSLVTKSCPTLATPKDCSLPGSYVHGLLQATILEWVANDDKTLLWGRGRLPGMRGLGSHMKPRSLYHISIKEPLKGLDRAWSIICYAENTPEVVLTDLSLNVCTVFQFLLPFLSFSSSGLTIGINFVTGTSLVHQDSAQSPLCL